MSNEKQPTNGPYHWGAGPQPKREGILSKIVKALGKGKGKGGK